MSLVKLANGQQFEIETPSGTRDGILRQRERKILPLVPTEVERYAEFKEAISDPANTETITVYFPDEKAGTPDEILDADKGPAHEVYEGFTIVGEIKETDKVVEPGTPNTAPVYGRQLSVELGQRQHGEE